MRRAWMAGLLWMLGCGGGGPGAAPAATGTSELSALKAEVGDDARHGLIAAGEDTIVVPASVFGTTTDIIGRFLFVAVRDGQGRVHGLYRVFEASDAPTLRYSGALPCAGLYDFNGLTGNRAKVGGRIDATDDSSVAVGSFIWWQAIDNRGLHQPDQSTLPGFGDEVANEAFCGSSTPPRFGPFDVLQGNIVVSPSGDDD